MAQPKSKQAAGAGNGSAPTERPGRVAAAASFEMFEQTNLQWRHVAPANVTADDLQSGSYLDTISRRLADFDVIHCIAADGSWYAQLLVIRGGRDAAGGSARGGARAILLPGYPVSLPRLEQRSGREAREGYEIRWDPFKRVHIPWWGDTPLNPDGFPRWEDADHLVRHHQEQAARVARKES